MRLDARPIHRHLRVAFLCPRALREFQHLMRRANPFIPFIPFVHTRSYL